MLHFKYLVQYWRSLFLFYLYLLVLTEIRLLVIAVPGLALICHPHHLQKIILLLLLWVNVYKNPTHNRLNNGSHVNVLTLSNSPGTIGDSYQCSSWVVSYHPRLSLSVYLTASRESQQSSGRFYSSKLKRSVSSAPVTYLRVGRLPWSVVFFKRVTCTTV